MNYLTLVSAVCVALASTLSFSGVNAAWFSSRQLVGGSALSLCAGGLAGFVLGLMPDMAAGVGLGVLFCIMNERMLNSLFPTSKKRLLFVGVLLVVSMSAAYWSGMAFHMLCSCLLLLSGSMDIYRHWHDTKISIFSSADLEAGDCTLRSIEGAVQLKEFPNIYILFLESIHSAQALRELYDMDDAGLADFLRSKDFTVYENTFSNETCTSRSLFSLLRMAPAADNERGEPEAFRILRANGYDIQLFDVYYHTFHPYAKYVSYFNFSIPKWVGKIYDMFIPFFMQSKVFMAITKNIDPFSDLCSYDTIASAFNERILHGPHDRQCYIMRFGAEHTLVTYQWSQYKMWKNKYIKLYKEAVENVKDMTARIVAHDPRACIYLMGDHGAWQYRASWHDGADPNESMLAKGLHPSLVAQDVAGVILAVRPSDGRRLPQQILTPMNAFRLLFSLLGGEGESLRFLPNESLLWENGRLYSYIIAREGKALDRWEKDSPTAAASRRAKVVEGSPDNVDVLLDLADALIRGGDLNGALRILEEGRKRFGDSPDLVLKLADTLAHLGKAFQAYTVLAQALDASGDPRLLPPFLGCVSLCKSAELAKKFLSSHPAADGLSAFERLDALISIFLARGDVEGAEPWLRESVAHPFDKNWEVASQQLQHCRLYAWALDALGKTDEGAESSRNIPQEIRRNPSLCNNLVATDAALSMRLQRWEEAEVHVRQALQSMTQPRPLTLHLWLAGALEGQGRNDEALETLENLVPQMKTTPLFMAQIGLFVMRHRIEDRRFRECKNLGALYLREMRQRIQDIFDAEFYCERNKNIFKQNMEPVVHFLHHARLWALDPCSLFNTAYYAAMQCDIFYQGIDPVWHYLICSPFELRDASLRFPTLFYMAQHPRLPWPYVNPLCHAMQERKKAIIRTKQHASSKEE